MTDFLLLATIFLVAGVVAVPIASRLGLGSVLGYLIAGIAISPLLAVLNVDVVSIQHFAEFGVVMMLFLVGLELEPKMLWAMRARLLGIGGGQVGITTLAFMALAMLLGQPWTISLAIGMILSLSSTAIVLQTLNEKGLMKSDGGQASFQVLLFEDIAVIPMLAFIPLLAMPDLLNVSMEITHATGGDAGHGGGDHGATMSLVDGLNGWQTALVNVAAIAAVVVIGSFLTGPIFRFVASANLRELFTATALMIVIGIALLMSLVGLSPALGTFLAGVVLANSAYRHELESDIDPFKGLLLGLFFMTVGAAINFSLLFANFGSILGMTIGVIVVKALVLLLLAVIFKLKGGDRWLFTLGMAQTGEFGFVLLSFTVANSVMPQAIADQLLLVVALSMLFTPALFILYERVLLPRMTTHEASRGADTIDESNHVIIAGHGRVGGIVNRIFRAAGIPVTVIDFSSKQLEMLQKFGFRAYFGDATRPDMLHSAGIHEARLFVIAIDEKDQITELVTYMHENYPHVHVVARAIDRNHVYELWAAGCRDIIRETYDSSLRMGRSALEAMGYSRDQATRMTQAFNDMDRESMIELAQHVDPHIPTQENKVYQQKVREMADTWERDLGVKLRAIMDEKKSGA